MNSTKKAFLVNIDRCIGCYACEIACKDENDLASGIRRVMIKIIEAGKLNRFYVPEFSLDAMDVSGCTLCPQLQVEGRTPACVGNCLTNALGFGDLEEVEKRADTIPGFKIQKEQRKGTTIYTSKKPLDSFLASC
jgi:Fe-S-cluster-containing dehydrogenase component